MSTPVFFSCTPARKNLNNEIENEVYAIVSFHPPAMDTSQRPPLDLAVALDVSGSMGGSKLEAAKKSLLKLVEHLTDRDFLSVTVFATHVEVTLPRVAMTVENKRTAVERIKGLHTRDMTNLSGGVLQALALIRDAKPALDGGLRRCMAFTDGHQNAGISDPTALVAAVLEYRSGIGISTFGYGADHNPDLLGKLAADGAFYYIDTPDRILTAFGTELGGLISTYAQNVVVKITPADGVEVLEVLNDLTVTEELDGEKKVAVVRCDDLLAESPYHVVVKLKVSKRDNAHPRDVALFTATADYFDVKTKAQASHNTATLKVRFVKPGKEDKKDATEVAEEVATHLLVRATNEAEKLAAIGDFHGTHAVYAVSAAYSADIGSAKGAALHAMGLGLAEALGDQEAYRGGGQHTSMSNKKALSRQRAGSAGSQVGGVVADDLFGTRVVQEMARNFEAAAAAPVPDPAASVMQPSPRSSFEKSRRHSS